MKKLLLIALLLISGLAQAKNLADSEADQAVEKNAFTCGAGNIFTLKGFAGDSYGFFLPKRNNADYISCHEFIRNRYIEGSQILFKFFEQVDKAASNVTTYAQIFAYDTKFNNEDREKIIAQFKKLGLDLTTVPSRMIIALGNVEGRFRKSASREYSALNPAYIAELKALIPLATIYSEPFFPNLYGRRKIFFGIEAIKLQALAALTDSDELKAVAKELADSFKMAAVGDYVDTGKNVDPNSLSALHFLHLTGRIAYVTFVREHYLELDEVNEIPAILSIKDTEGKIRSLQVFNLRANRRVDSTACGLVAGALLDSNSKELTQELIRTHNRLNCPEPLQYIKGPVRFTGSLALNAAFEYGSSADLKDLAEQANKNCEVSDDFEKMAALSKVGAEYLTKAIASGCQKAATAWARALAKSESISEILRAIPENASAEIKTTVFRTAITQIPANNRTVSREEMAEARRRIGPLAERMLKVTQRHDNVQTREMLFSAVHDDDDDLIVLNWHGVKIEIDQNSVNRTQQKLIDSIRLTHTPEETILPLSEALVNLQAENRQVRDRDVIERSISEFLVERMETLAAALAAAKTHLDKTLENPSGRAQYNLSATSVFDILLRGRMQCASGTDFMLLHAARAKGLSEGDKKAVVIVKPGHVLPGLATVNGAVEGIESTIAGRAQVQINLNGRNLPDNHNVILAEDYLLAKTLGSALKDADAVKTALSARAEKVLGLKQGKIIEEPKPATFVVASSDGLNNSIFGFGRADVPAGDLPRVKMDVVPSDLGAGEIANLSRPRPAGGSRLSRFPEVQETIQAPPGGIVGREHRPSELLNVINARLNPMEHVLQSITREMEDREPVAQYMPRLEVKLRTLVSKDLASQLESISRSQGVVVDIVDPNSRLSTIVTSRDTSAQQRFHSIVLPNIAEYLAKHVSNYIVELSFSTNQIFHSKTYYGQQALFPRVLHLIRIVWKQGSEMKSVVLSVNESLGELSVRAITPGELREPVRPILEKGVQSQQATPHNGVTGQPAAPIVDVEE